MSAIQVLLIEDDEDDVLIATDLLEAVDSCTYDVTWVADLNKAVEELRSGTHDVCLIDFRLGRTTGVEMLEQCRESLRRTPAILLTGDDNAEVDRAAMEAGASDYLVKSELTTAMLDRTIRYVLQRRDADARIEYLAFHDPLTDLPNRVLFAERVQQAILRASRHQREVVVVFFDLDNFKDINDTRGHAAGDILLTQVARRIRGLLRSEDTLARLGGDEFAILIELDESETQVARAIDRVRHSLALPFDIEAGSPVSVAASFGIASTRDANVNPEELLRNADIAMYESKRCGKDTWSTYQSAMHDALKRRISLERDLRTAIEDETLEVHYQPFVSLDTGEVRGFEALARWTHPDYGPQEPQEFVGLAEQSALIVRLGEYVLNRARRDTEKWANEAGFDGFVSVNFSPRHILDDSFLDTLSAALERWSLPPRSLVIEFTESVISGDVDRATSVLDKASELGVGVALDDFGTGYSSLSIVNQLPIDILKVDRSFVASYRDPKGLSMLSTIAAMANSLDLVAIAEGIETEDELACTRELGFELGQGFYYSPAIPAPQIPDYLRSNRPLSRLFGSEPQS